MSKQFFTPLNGIINPEYRATEGVHKTASTPDILLGCPIALGDGQLENINNTCPGPYMIMRIALQPETPRH